MDKNLNMNYLGLASSSLAFSFTCFLYILLGKTMPFPLTVGYAVISVVLLSLIIFNAIVIIRKAYFKNK